MNSWTGPPTTTQSGGTSGGNKSSSHHYRAMVVDSGPIIKETNVAQWRDRADGFYTVPAVIQEIRDAKARHQLQQQWIPLLNLQVKEPSAQAMQRVVEFSKLTGDYPSLSAVDLQVLALVIDLEREGCPTLGHLRTTPKRTVGLGPMTTLNSKTTTTTTTSKDQEAANNDDNATPYGIVEEDEDDDNSKIASEKKSETLEDTQPQETKHDPIIVSAAPAGRPISASSWAKLVNPDIGSEMVQIDSSMTEMTLENTSTIEETTVNVANDDEDLGGQWDDAPEDIDPVPSLTTSKDSKDDFKDHSKNPKDITIDLESEFPSLAAASTVPYEGEDDNGGGGGGIPKDSATIDNLTSNDTESSNPTTKKVVFEGDYAMQARMEEERRLEDQERERRKQEALKPISKSGKLYNSFRKYGNLMKPAPMVKKVPKKKIVPKPMAAVAPEPTKNESETSKLIEQGHSRILGSAGAAGAAAGMMVGQDMKAEDDDGEGWITSTQDIKTLKNQTGGNLDPTRATMPSAEGNIPITAVGPPYSQRAACTTTDFAMQNVLLQMGLILLSVDGMQIRRLKSWVLRCGACFKIHTDPFDPKTGLRRMFCSHCGSDMIQRVSASVDGKTGRLKLHFSKKKQAKHTSARGTRFSLPKAGTGNRFQGDLLLREDQLLMGAWHQKVKKNGGGQAKNHAQSIFGKDLASNVGCQATALPNDIHVGFGRRNPNASKGRDRRGKKKKSSDRACGLRRY